MNFIPCRMEERRRRLERPAHRPADVPGAAGARRAATAATPQNGKLLLGLRPEHITEARPHLEPGEVPFEAKLDVTEPMGMETLVYFPHQRHAGVRPRQPERRRQATARRCGSPPTSTTCT